jgi:hypothetical protein
VAPDYRPMYDMAANYLLPRWHGGPGDLEQYARYVADQITSSGGNIRYAEIAFVAAQRELFRFSQHKFDMARIEDGIRQREAQYSRPAENYGMLARIAYMARDRAATRRAMAVITQYGPEVDAVWGSEDIFGWVRDWASSNVTAYDFAFAEILRPMTPQQRRAAVEQIPDVNQRDAEGETLLGYVMSSGDRQLTDYVLSRGADIRTTGSLWLPISAAATQGWTDLVQKALDAGVSPRQATATGETPLHAVAAVDRDNTQVIKLLVSRDPSLVHLRMAKGLSPLMVAVRRGHAANVAALIAAGADVNATDPSGETPLHAAARLNNVRAAELLIKAGANPVARDAGGRSPLQLANLEKNPRVVQLLQANGVKQ